MATNPSPLLPTLLSATMWVLTAHPATATPAVVAPALVAHAGHDQAGDCCDPKGQGAAMSQGPGASCCDSHAMKDGKSAKAAEACCSPDGQGQAAACCTPDAHGKAMACCGSEAGNGMAGKAAESCDCDDDADEKGHESGHEHAMHEHAMHDHAAMKAHERMHGGMMGWGPHAHMKGQRFEPEVRYMPATTKNQYLVFGHGLSKALNPWASVGFQHNCAIQLGSTDANAGSWIADYGGVVPRLGFTSGNFEGNIGALVGVGAMGRTVQLPNANPAVNDVLQLRLLWAVEPRIEIGLKHEDWGTSLVGTYLVSQYPADLGGYSVGLKFSFRGPHKHGDW